MVSREEAVEFLHLQFEIEVTAKSDAVNIHHYGICELRQLLDYIYEGKPGNDNENIKRTFHFGPPYAVRSRTYRPWEND